MSAKVMRPDILFFWGEGGGLIVGFRDLYLGEMNGSMGGSDHVAGGLSATDFLCAVVCQKKTRRIGHWGIDDIHLRIFLRVHDGRDGDTKVRHGAPEI